LFLWLCTAWHSLPETLSHFPLLGNCTNIYICESEGRERGNRCFLAFKLIRNLNPVRSEGSGTAFPPTALSTTAGRHSQVEGQTRDTRERVCQALLVLMGDIGSQSQKYYENMKFHSKVFRALDSANFLTLPASSLLCLHTLHTCISSTILPRRDVRCLLDLIVFLCNTLSSSQLTEAKARIENKAYFPQLDLSGESL